MITNHIAVPQVQLAQTGRTRTGTIQAIAVIASAILRKRVILRTAIVPRTVVVQQIQIR